MWTRLLAASILGIVGCSSRPTQSGGQPDSGEPDSGVLSRLSPFVGTWFCTETVVETGVGAQTSTSTLTVVAAANSQITETASEDGGPVCTLTASISGSSAILSPGQCSVASGVTLDFTSGTEAVSGGTLTYAFVFTQTDEAGSCAGTASGICTNGDASQASQGLSCSPQPVDGGIPAFAPPNQPQAVCTPAQIEAYYNACWAPGSSNATCDPFNGDPANSPCIKCMYVGENAKFYGAVIAYGSGDQTNVGGCIALVDGDASPSGCGAAYQTYVLCGNQACELCPAGTAYDNCQTKADFFGVCQPYAQTAQCAQASQYNGCFFTDFESYFRGIGQMFCAAASSDAGIGDAGDGGASDSAPDAVRDAPGEAMAE
jgi:hypothetical protein